MSTEFVLKASCEATSGIVAAVTSYLAANDCYIAEMHQFDDEDSNRFFMRAECRIQNANMTIDTIRAGFDAQVAQFNMEWDILDKSEPVKVLLMVSKFDHCLDDLLYRHRKGELPMEITAVVSNHKDLRSMAEREGIRFVHLPVNKDNKAEQEAALLDIMAETQTDLVVLARYMQILSDSLCKKLQGRAINIHHSFLPGFKGAKPYHQAHHRGVKLIGATAHYVTSDLDEGPIIEQSVQPVDHTFSPERLVAVGRDTETVALANAVRMHLEHRVFMYGNKSVVFK
ncbi:formyltetrahydrofolate deformylase [Marinomonas sp. A79]|uniref:Formyltetrahydrofolate deformylase n=1 Tax=Marinomonas vulgaris TaxID=2823372 RepID=A0ABS5H9U9_9GAMM|nr:formyltetrahydrofolate deformylase [Marinomonas vulgaris]MBR7888395.1 formyltetrahydrofolate deformylase [Marinomonas vulgaris]